MRADSVYYLQTGSSIDLSEVLFKSLADMSKGRISGVEWWFN